MSLGRPVQSLHPSRASPVAALRMATADAHHQLDHASRLSRLAQSDFQESELVDLLLLLLDLHEAVERLDLWPEASLGLDTEVPRSHLLRQDLFALVGEGTAGILTKRPQLNLELKTEAREFTAGCLYVVEGSRLGGEVIRRRLLTSLGPSAEEFTSFFGSGGLRAGPRWALVCEYLGTVLHTPFAVQVACSGAVQAYSWFSRSFEAGSPSPVSIHADADEVAPKP